MITPALHNAFVKFGPLFRGDLIERTVYRETGNLPFSLSLSLLFPAPPPCPSLSSRPLLCPILSFSSRDRFLEVVHTESVQPRRFVSTGARSPVPVLSISSCVSLRHYENVACQVTRLLCNHWTAGDWQRVANEFPVQCPMYNALFFPASNDTLSFLCNDRIIAPTSE